MLPDTGSISLAAVMYKGPITWIVLGLFGVFTVIYFVTRRQRK